MSHQTTLIDAGGHVVARIVSNGQTQRLLDGATSRVLGYYVHGQTLTSGGKRIGSGNQILRLLDEKNRR